MLYVIVFLTCCMSFDIAASGAPLSITPISQMSDNTPASFTSITPSALKALGSSQPNLSPQNSGSHLASSSTQVPPSANPGQRTHSEETFQLNSQDSWVSRESSSFTLARPPVSPLTSENSKCRTGSSLIVEDVETPLAHNLTKDQGPHADKKLQDQDVDKALQEAKARMIADRQMIERRIKLREDIALLQHVLNLAAPGSQRAAHIRETLRLKEAELASMK